MEPLFEAKVTINEQLTSYNISRLTHEIYKAILIPGDENGEPSGAPVELNLVKKEGKWSTEENEYVELANTLGDEIDVFNYGYGDLLGKLDGSNFSK